MQDKFWNDTQVVAGFADRPCSKYITDTIDKVLSNNKINKAIDVGCGGGRYSVYLVNKGVNVVAVDKNKAMVDFVNSKGINTLLADMKKIDVKDSVFDLILSIGVLHNATTEENYIDSIKELKRMLAPSGHLIISVFTNDIISSDLIHNGGSEYLIKEGRPPMVLYSKNKIKELFNKEGFEILEVIDEHITNVGTGERNVLSLYIRKK